MELGSSQCHKKKVCPFHTNKKKNSKSKLEKKSCCTNLNIAFEGFDFEESELNIGLEDSDVSYLMNEFSKFELTNSEYSSYKQSRPPPLPEFKKNFQELFCVLII